MLTLRLVAEPEFEELTALLHRAYAVHAAAGLRFAATHQSVQTTRERAGAGECWVGEQNGKLVATVTVIPPHMGRSLADAGCATYAATGVAKVNQLAVEPALKRQGYGALLMDHAEARARALGAHTLALDTAAPAETTIAWYQRRGYTICDRCDWRPHVNYESVVLKLAL